MVLKYFYPLLALVCCYSLGCSNSGNPTGGLSPSLTFTPPGVGSWYAFSGERYNEDGSIRESYLDTLKVSAILPSYLGRTNVRQFSRRGVPVMWIAYDSPHELVERNFLLWDWQYAWADHAREYSSTTKNERIVKDSLRVTEQSKTYFLIKGKQQYVPVERLSHCIHERDTVYGGSSLACDLGPVQVLVMPEIGIYCQQKADSWKSTLIDYEFKP